MDFGLDDRIVNEEELYKALKYHGLIEKRNSIAKEEKENKIEEIK